MENWNIIITFNYTHEAYLVKTLLESEGIAVQITDELTAQVNPFYSNAIGGVKLQVQTKDFKLAKKILLKKGYIKESNDRQNSLLVKVDILTSKLPIIGKSILELRLLVLVALFLVIVLVPIVLLSLPSTKERLIENGWCIEDCVYMGKAYFPNTIEPISFNDGTCQEYIYFQNNGIITFPGFNTGKINARWEIEDEKLKIFDSDTLSHVFDGLYQIKFYHNSIKFTSDKTVFHGFPKLRRW